MLASEESKAIGKEMGIEDPQKADECLKCHLTGHGEAAEAFGPKYTPDEGVGCEACHGPGSLYKKRKVMKDQAASLKVGLKIPDEKVCKECHNEESPKYEGFDFEEMVKKIAHAKPKAEG